jgi:hypothetical protein
LQPTQTSVPTSSRSGNCRAGASPANLRRIAADTAASYRVATVSNPNNPSLTAARPL